MKMARGLTLALAAAALTALLALVVVTTGATRAEAAYDPYYCSQGILEYCEGAPPATPTPTPQPAASCTPQVPAQGVIYEAREMFALACLNPDDAPYGTWAMAYPLRDYIVGLTCANGMNLWFTGDANVQYLCDEVPGAKSHYYGGECLYIIDPQAITTYGDPNADFVQAGNTFRNVNVHESFHCSHVLTEHTEQQAHDYACSRWPVSPWWIYRPAYGYLLTSVC